MGWLPPCTLPLMDFALLTRFEPGAVDNIFEQPDVNKAPVASKTSRLRFAPVSWGRLLPIMVFPPKGYLAVCSTKRLPWRREKMTRKRDFWRRYDRSENYKHSRTSCKSWVENATLPLHKRLARASNYCSSEN